MCVIYEVEVVWMGDVIELRDLRDIFVICNILILSDMLVFVFLRFELLLNCLFSLMFCVVVGVIIFCGLISELVFCVMMMLNVEYCCSWFKIVF